FLRGNKDGFTKPALDLLTSRQTQLSEAFGISLAVASSGGSSGARGVRVPGMWTTDYAWTYIGQLFAVQYLSGATMFETTYKPGEWTRWQITTADSPDEKETIERAFIGTASDGSGGEW